MAVPVVFFVALVLIAGVVFLGKKQPVSTSGRISAATPTPTPTLDWQEMKACIDSVISFDKTVNSFLTERTRALKTLNSSSASNAATVRALDRFGGKLTALRYSAERLNPPTAFAAANLVFVGVLDQTKDAIRNISLGLAAESTLRYEQGRLDFNEAGQTLGAALQTITPSVRSNACPTADFYS